MGITSHVVKGMESIECESWLEYEQVKKRIAC